MLEDSNIVSGKIPTVRIVSTKSYDRTDILKIESLSLKLANSTAGDNFSDICRSSGVAKGLNFGRKQ
jgi:hypothetical protein